MCVVVVWRTFRPGAMRHERWDMGREGRERIPWGFMGRVIDIFLLLMDNHVDDANVMGGLVCNLAVKLNTGGLDTGGRTDRQRCQ